MARYGDPYSEFVLCIQPIQVHTHTHTHTHRDNTHGEQLGVRCLAQGSHLSRGIAGGESVGYSLLTPRIPAGPGTQNRSLRVIRPTLYPLGHNCPKLQSEPARSQT